MQGLVRLGLGCWHYKVFAVEGYLVPGKAQVTKTQIINPKPQTLIIKTMRQHRDPPKKVVCH